MGSEFNTEQFGDVYADGMETSYWNLARNRIISHYIKENNLSQILDVGCGRGIVTTYLHQSGVSVTGVEIGTAVPIKKTDALIYYGTDARDLPENFRNSIKTLSFFDVIEHIEEPVSFIKGIASFYPNVENIIITVPARKELWTNFDEHYGHYRRYDLNMIEEELKAAEFNKVYKKYFFHTLYLLIYPLTFGKIERKISFKPPGGFISRKINQFMAFSLYLDTFIFPSRLAGTSILYIGKKA
jgi:hypothetical protein